MSGAMALAFAAAVAAWPGVAVYDSVVQYGQALGGSYDDWHPPILAWVWSRLIAVGRRGTAPLLVLQMLFYWGGLGLLAAGFAQSSVVSDRIGHSRKKRVGFAVGGRKLVAGVTP